MEEPPFPPHTPPDMSQGQQYTSNHARNQAQNQAQGRTRSRSQTQIRLQPQPHQNAVVNANNTVPRWGFRMNRPMQLGFQYRNGRLICRKVETREEIVFNVRVIVVSTLATTLCPQTRTVVVCLRQRDIETPSYSGFLCYSK